MNETTPPGQFSAAYWENRATKLLGQLEATTEENVRLRAALHQIWLMADAEEALSVKAGAIAQDALGPRRRREGLTDRLLDGRQAR